MLHRHSSPERTNPTLALERVFHHKGEWGKWCWVGCRRTRSTRIWDLCIPQEATRRLESHTTEISSIATFGGVGLFALFYILKQVTSVFSCLVQFCCEGPEVFYGIINFTRPVSSAGGLDNDWIFIFRFCFFNSKLKGFMSAKRFLPLRPFIPSHKPHQLVGRIKVGQQIFKHSADVLIQTGLQLVSRLLVSV